MKKRILLIAILTVVCCMFAQFTYAANADIANGTYGSVPWRVTFDGELLIGETGEVYTYTKDTFSVNPSSNAPWYQYSSSIKTVRILGTVNGNGMHCGMFRSLSNCKNAYLSGFNTDNVTDMREMFYGCQSLQTLDLSNFNTENVENMSGMFMRSGITSLDISSFDTSNVFMMKQMFRECAFTSLVLRHFDTSKVVNMSEMFYNCVLLTELDVSSFNTKDVRDFNRMFMSCINLNSIDVSGFDTSNANNIAYMFWGCSSLPQIDTSHFNTANVTDMMRAFYGCEGLTSLDVSNFNTGKVTNMSELFAGCSNVKYLDLSQFNMSEYPDSTNMLAGLTSLDTISLGTEVKLNSTGWGKSISGLKIEPYDNWKQDNASREYNVSELVDSYDGNTMNGTYYRVHSWGEPVVTKEATCTESGVEEYTCSNCKTKRTEALPALDHSWNDLPTVDKAATCTNEGSESIHCSRCGVIKEGSENIVPRTGHKFGIWKTTKAATEIATGERTRTCSNCDEIEKQTTVQLAPSLAAVKIKKPKVAKKSATIKWKKLSKTNQKKIASIQIQYSLDKTFKTNVKTVTAKKSASSKKIKKLTSKKTYYVRVRAYKKSGGVVHISKWSAVKSIKVK